MSEDIHKWSDGRYTLMFDEHTFFVFDNVKEERMTALNVTKKLNEQQDTIFKLQDLCGKSDYENAKLREEVNLLRPTNLEQYEQIQKLQEENEQLQAQLREKEEDEQLYANEIVKLNKEAKEVLDFKSLGGDY